VRTARLSTIIVVGLCAAAAWGQSGAQIGYLYPAGGQQGTTCEIIAGGQRLRSPEAVLITGEGVSAEVIEWAGPMAGNNRGILTRHLRLLVKFRTQELAAKAGRGEAPDPAKLAEERGKLDELPEHPMCRGLDEMGLVELTDLINGLYNPKEQPNTQLGETVALKITIDADALPGDREVRLVTRSGITSPMIFQVGLLPEAREVEPNDPGPPRNPRIDAMRDKPEPLELPVLVNGQIMPGDVDRFRFIAQQGQQLVVQVEARHLVPYLADAVPGWFQATVALFGADGEELAFADEYLFSPDPVLYYEIPASGEYELEVRDAIYRGRQDFVYRVSIGEEPFIRWIYPLGGNWQDTTTVQVGGWHLPRDEVKLGTEGMPTSIRESQWTCDAGLCNRVLYAVDALPELMDSEPNDSLEDSQMIVLPLIVNGRIDRPGDVDCFSFQGEAGEEVVAEVYGRRLRSPIDSVVRLCDASGKVVAWNDDHMNKEGHLHTGPGLLTHYADSYMRTQLPEDGGYYFEIADTQGQGGEEWGYRLHLSPPRPDFELKMTPASFVVHAGRSAAVSVYALRRDGFDGPIDVRLLDPPPGFTLEGGQIPAGRQSTRMTLSVPKDAGVEPLALYFVGEAQIGDELVEHDVTPADNQMQAFLWRHLVPMQEMITKVDPGRRYIPSFEVACELPLLIPRGGTVELPVIVVGKMPEGATPRLALNEPPNGISLQKVTADEGGLTAIIEASDSVLLAGYADNLIVDVEVEFERKNNDGQMRKWKTPCGSMRAIPFEIVAK